MNIEALNVLAFSGGAWVIYLLIGCSVWAVAVIVERIMMYVKEKKAFEVIFREMAAHMSSGHWEEAVQLCNKFPGAVSNMLLAGLTHVQSGVDTMEEHVSAVRILEKKNLEKHLIVLGTLGNNAPFIGLFGTVLGVIKAFHDLAATSAAGPEVVMQGLSEALIATAVGLLVAIPSVVAYNYFQKRINDLLGETEALIRMMAAKLKEK